MKQPHTQSRGIISIEIVLVAIAVAIAAFALYRAYEARALPIHKTTSAGTANAAKPAQAKPLALGTSSAASDEYQVRSLNFEMNLPSGLTASDLYYVVDTTPQTYTTYTGQSYTVNAQADFSTRSLTAAEPACAASLAPTGGRGIDDVQITTLNPADGLTEAPSQWVRLGPNSYLDLASKQAPCSTNDPNATLELQQYHLLEQAIQTAQPIKSATD